MWARTRPMEARNKSHQLHCRLGKGLEFHLILTRTFGTTHSAVIQQQLNSSLSRSFNFVKREKNIPFDLLILTTEKKKNTKLSNCGHTTVCSFIEISGG